MAGLRVHGSGFTVQYKGHVLTNDAARHVLILGGEILWAAVQETALETPNTLSKCFKVDMRSIFVQMRTGRAIPVRDRGAE